MEFLPAPDDVGERIDLRLRGLIPWRKDSAGTQWYCDREWAAHIDATEKFDAIKARSQHPAMLYGVPLSDVQAAVDDDDRDDEVDDDQTEETAGDELIDAIMNRLVALEGRVAALEQAEPEPAEETSDDE